MFCAVNGCKKIAMYVYMIHRNKKDSNSRIEFNLCEEHNKYQWEIIENKEKPRRCES